MAKGTTKRGGRPGLTREMLLPLPTRVVRELSLANHLALVSMRDGHGTEDTMISLLRVLYVTWCMVERSVQHDDVALFVEAEELLQKSIAAARQGTGWTLGEHAVGVAEHLLVRFDQVIDGIPKHRYMDAIERTGRFVVSAQTSPIPGSRLLDK